MTDRKKSPDSFTSNPEISETQLTSNPDRTGNQPSNDRQTSPIDGESATSNVQEESQAYPPSTTNVQTTGTSEVEYQAVEDIFDFYHNSSDFELQAPGASHNDSIPATNPSPNDNTAPSNNHSLNNGPSSNNNPAQDLNQPLTGTQLHDAIEQELGFGPRVSSLEYHDQNVGPGGYLDPSQPLTTQQATVSHPVIQRVVAGLQQDFTGQQQQPGVQQQPTVQQGPTASTARDPRQLCICLGTHIGGNMVRCANDDCPKRWFHAECVGEQSRDWLCPVCKQVRPNQEAFGAWKKNT